MLRRCLDIPSPSRKPPSQLLALNIYLIVEGSLFTYIKGRAHVASDAIAGQCLHFTWDYDSDRRASIYARDHLPSPLSVNPTRYCPYRYTVLPGDNQPKKLSCTSHRAVSCLRLIGHTTANYIYHRSLWCQTCKTTWNYYPYCTSYRIRFEVVHSEEHLSRT